MCKTGRDISRILMQRRSIANVYNMKRAHQYNDKEARETRVPFGLKSFINELLLPYASYNRSHGELGISAHLQSVPETDETLNGLAASIRAAVGPHELQVEEKRDDNDEGTGDHGGDHTRVVVRLVLLTEDGGANDTTNAAEADESGTAESTLPLSTNVVRLPCEDGRDVGVASSGSEEDTEVPDTNILGVAKKTETEKA